MDLFDKAVAVAWLALTYQQNRILRAGNPPTATSPSWTRNLVHYWPTGLVVLLGIVIILRPNLSSLIPGYLRSTPAGSSSQAQMLSPELAQLRTENAKLDAQVRDLGGRLSADETKLKNWQDWQTRQAKIITAITEQLPGYASEITASKGTPGPKAKHLYADLSSLLETPHF